MKRTSMKRQYKTLRPWLLRVAALAFAAFIILTVAPGSYNAYAAEETIIEKFDRVDVMTDLESATINGKPFDRNDYKPHDLYKSARLISLTEFCYGYHEDNRGDYGLYLYIYSPDGREIELESESNKLQIAVDYEGGLPVDYEKYALKICSVSEDNAFVKARVIDRPSDKTGKTILERVGRLKRRYDLSSVELHYKGDANARDFVIGGTFNFTGFAKGYGESHKADSTLDCTVQELFTVELDVKNAYFRTDVGSAKNHQNELNTVYFGVDNELLREYGKLQKIKAEWYEYKTRPFIVSDDKDLVDALRPFAGVDIGTHTDELKYRLFGEPKISGGSAQTTYTYDWAYNLADFRGSNQWIIVHNRDTRIAGAFDTGGRDPSKYTVPAIELKTYIHNFNRFDTGSLPIKNDTISADLFQDTVDDSRLPLFENTGRKNGYVCQEINADDAFDINSYLDQQNWFMALVDFGFFWFLNPDLKESFQNITPIYTVTDDDAALTGDDFKKNLFIDDRFEYEFKNYYNAAKAKDQTTFLFRFAMTDYFSETIYADLNKTDIKSGIYRATETVFFDFDILQLTFNRDGEFTVIPVVSNPIDIINDITPPYVPKTELPDWLKTLILIVLIILAVVVLLILLNFIPILKPVISLVFKAIWFFLKGVWFVVTLPFKGLYKLIQSIMAKAEDAS